MTFISGAVAVAGAGCREERELAGAEVFAGTTDGVDDNLSDLLG